MGLNCDFSLSGNREFLCFEEEVGLEQGLSKPSQTGYLDNKSFFLLPDSLCCYTQQQVAGPQAAGLQNYLPLNLTWMKTSIKDWQK